MIVRNSCRVDLPDWWEKPGFYGPEWLNDDAQFRPGDAARLTRRKPVSLA
jgi:hypothetical protein